MRDLGRASQGILFQQSMDPKLIKNGTEYQAACTRLRQLRAEARDPDTDAEIELWERLISWYEEQRPGGAASEQVRVFGFPVGSASFWRRANLLDKYPPVRWRSWVFFAVIALLFFARLQYRASYFPVFFEGEEAKVLELAKDTNICAANSGSWWEAFRGGVIEYNKGFFWVLVPLYQIFGYDVRLITTVLPIIFSLLCAAFLTLYRKTHPKGSALSFVLILVFSVLCVAMRRYKWHTVSYIPAIAVYLYFLPQYYHGRFPLGDRARKALALGLIGLSLYLYFGSILYAVPFSVLVFFFSSKANRRRELVFGAVCLVGFSLVFASIYHSTGDWRQRVHEELNSIAIGFTHDGMIFRWYSLKEFLYENQLSLPYLILFVTGLATGLVKAIRGDRFALITLVLFVPLFVFQSALSGLNNPDQLNWLMIPLLGVILIGADQILTVIRDRVPRGRLCS